MLVAASLALAVAMACLTWQRIPAALVASAAGGSTGNILAIAVLLNAVAIGTIAVVQKNHRRAGEIATTEARRHEQDASQLLAGFEDCSNDWLWETDSDLRFTYASRKLRAVLGVASSKLDGIPFDRLAGSELPASTGWDMLKGQMARYDRIDNCEVESWQDGTLHWFSLTARPLFDADGAFRGYRGVGHDVTDEKEAFARLLAAKADSESANAAKSQFLAVMSHELRTPLNAIVGFSELLASPQADSLTESARNDHLRTVLESGRHLQAMISDVLDASRIERGTMRLAEQDGDAAEILEVSVKMCRRLAEECDCTIVASLMDGIEIRGDITRLERILINLVTNAVKFSSPGSVVNAEIERLAGGDLAFVVKDRGIGIDPPAVERMFDQFAQADTGAARRFGGIGLGLSIARNLARLHGGEVTLSSEVGVGTTARLVLPAERVTWPAGVAAAMNTI